MKAKASQMWSRLTTMLFVLFCFTAAWAQKTVTGTVVDNQGEPILGVNVVVKGTTNGAMTDIDGNFSIAKVDENAVLHVSFVGYAAQEVPVAGKTVFKIELAEDSQLLEEVVAIGYGTTKKGSVTGSIAKVDAAKLNDRPITGVGSALQGQLAGVAISTTTGQPGEETRIRVRGAASIHASSEPLYVIDGVAADNLNSINPADIESIEVLKDASSSAIYGSRGANGVVLVTTKHGKSGKAKIDFQGSWGWQQMEKKIDLMNAEEYIWARKYQNNQRYMNKYASQGASVNDDWNTRYDRIGKFDNSMMSDPRWENNGMGLSNAASYKGAPVDLGQDLAYLDWQDEFYRTAPMQQYQLAVSGGSDKTTYRASAGWLDQDGIVTNTGYKRLTLRASIDSEVNKYIKYGISVAPTISWTKGGGVDNKDAESHHCLSMVPMVEAEAGNKSGSNPYSAYTWAGSTVSPVEVMNQTTNDRDITRILSSAYLKFDLTHGFTATATGSWSFYDSQTRKFEPDGIRNSSGWKTNPEGSNSRLTRTDARTNRFQIETLLNYHKEIGKHDIQGMLGWSTEEVSAWNTSLMGVGLPNNSLQTATSSTMSTWNTTTIDTSTPSRLLSYFGRAQYDYAGKYLVTASVRRDGSSLFGKNAKWGWFPAASAAWRISNESFWPEDFWWNTLKVRGSWGMNGNNSIPATAALSVLSSANYAWGNAVATGLASSATANPDLGWEKTNSWNVALDLGFFNNRIAVSADYYQKTTEDLLYQVTVPSVLGYTTAWDNIGTIENKGFELELTTQNIVTRDFQWSMNVNLGWNTNEVTELANHQSVEIGSFSTQILKEGQPLKAYHLYKVIGVFTSQEDLDKYPHLSNQTLGDVIYEDINGDGKIDADDRDFCGSAAPKLTYGWTNNFKYKQFDLSVLVTGQAGGKVYGLLGRAIDRAGMGTGGNFLQHWANGWYDEKFMDATMKQQYEARGGFDGKTPALVEGHNGTANYDTRWLYSSDFIKIKNITLGYNLPAKYTKKAGLSFCRFYASVENAFMWDHYDYYSPEVGNSSAPNTAGGVAGDVDYGSYPNARVYSLGINLSF